ncbi:hypothetical protein WJX84_001270 [Apatococcus fuscideae]|uniref:Uncharacterized protein n=1 Tax=Apatococcus fuscideae TaxID=2026836 RepID=A0AAW1T8B3_9CHLO
MRRENAAPSRSAGVRKNHSPGPDNFSRNLPVDLTITIEHLTKESYERKKAEVKQLHQASLKDVSTTLLAELSTAHEATEPFEATKAV